MKTLKLLPLLLLWGCGVPNYALTDNNYDKVNALFPRCSIVSSDGSHYVVRDTANVTHTLSFEFGQVVKIDNKTVR